MPWYKAGTVKTTNNSNAIIGAGTAFIANSRVGDAFRGPDGAWYEVTNIASDTALSISPNYQGPTVAAGAYALAPMQGYVKDLADQARAIIQQWGATLAGLGTVSTENVVPFTKGGLGTTSKAAAKIALDMGTAASANLTINQVDGTAGRVLKSSDWGIGTDKVPIAPTVNLTQSGFWRWDDNTAFWANYGALSGSIISCGFDAENCAQIFIGRITTSLIGFRSGSGNFNVIYHTGNTTRAADGTLKAI